MPPPWLTHLVHLTAYSWSTFLGEIGTTGIGFCVSLVVAVASIVATAYRIYRKHGREAMLKHWKEDAVTALWVTLVCASVVYIPVFLFSIAATIYHDHMVQRGVVIAQRNAIKRISSAPTGANIHLVSDLKKHVTMVYLTDKVQVPAVVLMTCDGPVVKPAARMAETKIMLERPPAQIPSTNTWAFEIESPAWTPTEPMFIDYEYQTATMPKCGFEAR